jgi:hypothetical protein
MKKLLAVAVASLLAVSGCMGIIINGSSQEVTVNSSPSGAEVIIDGALAGETPLTVDLARGESHTAEVSLEGHDTESFRIKRSADGGIIVMDLLLTGGIGLLIDLGTGGMYRLSPTEIAADLNAVSINGNQIHVSMSPIGGAN